MAHKFHPWEGGEGKVTALYVSCLVEQAKQAIDAKALETAIELLNLAQHYPENLGEGKLFGAQENEVFYWLGCASQGMGLTDKANAYWETAARGLKQPALVIYYNDQNSESIYYQGMALNQLNRKEEARSRFETLVRFGNLHLNDEFNPDYFAVSLPDLQIWDDDLTKRNNQYCLNLIRLGELGLSQI